MTRFIQLHVLTSYPPSNLNRDDSGRPKSATVGGVPRLRVSSQSLKRAWRTSDAFKAALDGHIGTRTKSLGIGIYEQLIQAGVAQKMARESARQIAGQFGKIKDEKKTEGNEDLQIEQLAHFSPAERTAVDALVKTLSAEKRGPTDSELKLLRKDHAAVDIGLFGRMLAASPAYNIEAATQVAHAFTVHAAKVEDDYFTAVDELSDRGAGHVDHAGFGAGVFYLYVCINRELLDANLQGNSELRKQAIEALIHAIAKVSPTGKQNSFASRAYASLLLAEVGDEQPRSLATAFVQPVKDGNTISDAVKALARKRAGMEAMYGKCAEDFRVATETEYSEGFRSDQVKVVSLADLIAFVNRG